MASRPWRSTTLTYIRTREGFAEAVARDCSRTAEALRRLLAEWQDRSTATCCRPGEWQVLRAVAQGLSNKEISRELDISVDTVKLHLSIVAGN
ncbi:MULTISPECIES: response regulator transcription factor [unclassified Sphingomonas]|uniref:response regulator transcription factor n=1 Tax=unclassified Sphingomonas TaxID=196159 RepID=UPI0006F9E27B|nr:MULTISPECIES: LuxR C-terminal-related transcriptional regulator [unclassified Sphingomonas]KRB94604.1 hypothetical protein ASE22_01275 [Sphingomonas sp. Root720]